MSRLIALIIAVLATLQTFPAANSNIAPTALWIDPSETNEIGSRIYVFGNTDGYQLFLPSNAVLSECFLSWDGDMPATVDGQTYRSGSCPVPALETEKTYDFINDTQTIASFNITVYQGSANVQPVFIVIDESGENPTIEQMDSDPDHEVTCTGQINIGGQWYELSKIKGRGNVTWSQADDKRPYNITLGTKIKFPGIDSGKTKKWTFLAEIFDHSLLSNRSGFYLAHEIGIGQDTASADVWMNGEYQGCYTVTPKTDSFVTKDGFTIEQDNYLEPSVADGGDPQFTLVGLKESYGWSSFYNRITVKKMGDNLLLKDGEVDESPENMEATAAQIQTWLQDAWDAIRSDDGYNSKNKYYTEYIDLESFAKMYLMHEYVKSYDVCAGSILYHRDGQTDNDKLIAGPIWDLDNALGSTNRNKNLGAADDRWHGDRRSGEGDFIQNVQEYKSSVYKILSKHEDFMAEVTKQYNKYKDVFNSLEGVVENMADSIEASARMNHIKVKELSHDFHYYNYATTLGSGQYQQTYLTTTDSKTDWRNYVTNLETFIRTRTLWFANHYENAVETHKVTFDVGDIPEQIVEHGGRATIPDVIPTKQYCEFDAWCFEGEPFDFATEITEDITLTANYRTSLLRTAAVNFEGRIQIRFMFELLDSVMEADGACVVFEKADGTEILRTLIINGEDHGDRMGYYCPVIIKEFADDIIVKLVDRDGQAIPCFSASGTDLTNGYAYSAKEYAEKMMVNSSNPEMRELAKALYDYGIAAQIFFKYGEYSDLTVSEDVTNVTTDMMGEATKTSGTKPAGVKVSINGDFEADNSLYIFYTLPGGKTPSDYTFTVDGQTAELKYQEEKSRYYVRVGNIAAKNLADGHVFTISDGKDTFTVNASLISYAKGKAGNGSTPMKNLAKALYLYNKKADAYFGNG